MDDLERHLLRADYRDACRNPLSGAHPSYLLMLDGGVQALAKPADEGSGGDVMALHEVAAWRLVRQLGWDDLMGATVLRVIPSFQTGQPVRASVQVVAPNVEKIPDLATLPEDEVWRAAIFDMIAFATDRGSNNWLGYVQTTGEPKHLRLCDHGHAFEHEGRGFASDIHAFKAGQAIPDELMEALNRFQSDGPEQALVPLVAAQALENVVARARKLLASGILDPA